MADAPPKQPFDPWYKATLPLKALGTSLKLRVPHDVFSTMRIDEGTLLLLDHLPPHEPQSVLDMGCGYGALGLPVAARFPAAKIEMVDRDLLAVAWSQKNAVENELTNVNVHGSLGFRDLDPAGRPYDWILCNIPARIGRPFIENLFVQGRALLKPTGEIRVVVIRDLAPLVELIRVERNLPIAERTRGPRHVVFSLAANAFAGAAETAAPELYLRDVVEIGGLQLQRPFDLGGDDPQRLTKGLPVLLDALPRQAPKTVLCFRTGYGAVPLICRKRWPNARITVVERDLLAAEFTRRNAVQLQCAGENLEIREHAHFPDAFRPGERFAVALGEISPSAGDRVAQVEVRALAEHLEPGGEGFVLVLEKLAREWDLTGAGKKRIKLNPLIARDGYAVLRLVR